MEIILTIGLILSIIYSIYLKNENSKILKDKLELEDSLVSSYEIEEVLKSKLEKDKETIQFQEKYIKSLNEGLSFQEEKLKEILNDKSKSQVIMLEDKSNFKDESPKTIKRQYNKRKK